MKPEKYKTAPKFGAVYRKELKKVKIKG